jgi:endonuclease YncB( thermonuclease family)
MRGIHGVPPSGMWVLLAAGLALAALAPGSALVSSARADGKERVAVPKSALLLDDGDTVGIRGKDGVEAVRLLGIDTPETLHLEHDIPYAQAFGGDAATFLAGCVAMATTVEISRAPTKDAFGRTLAYLWLDGRNYSVLAIEARMAVETVSRFGDNGFPEEAAACVAAAKASGPVAFEDPHFYRRRMRNVSKWLKAHGLYPRGPATSEEKPAEKPAPKQDEKK